MAKIRDNIKREYRGCQPHSIGLLERCPRSSNKTSSRIYTDDENFAQKKTFAQWKVQWEDKLFETKVKNLTKMKFQVIKDQQRQLMDNKKDCLQELLKKEQIINAQETYDNSESRIDRINRLRKEVQDIRNKRELENNEIVKQKLEEQFKNSADPLRCLKQHYAELELKKSRDHQVLVALEIAENDREETKMWNNLISKNSILQEENELKNIAKKSENAKKLQEFLETQMDENNEKRQGQKQNDNELIDQLIQEAKLYELEKIVLKKENQKEMKFMLDRSLYLKKIRIDDEKEQENLYENKLNEQIQLDKGQEIEFNNERKNEMAREALQYLNYVRKNEVFEKQKEDEILSYVNEKQKTINEFNRQKKIAEKNKQRQLLDSISEFKESYKQQKEIEREVIKHDKIKAKNKMIEDSLQLENEKKEQFENEKNIKLTRKHEILAQIAHNDLLKQKKRNEQHLEELSMKQTEEIYNENMKKFIQEENEKNSKLFLK